MELTVVDGKNPTDKDTLDARCIVKMDGTTNVYTDFIAIGFHDDIYKPVDLFAQADVLSVAVSLELIKEFFMECYSRLEEDQQQDLNVAIYEFLKAKGLNTDEASAIIDPK